MVGKKKSSWFLSVNSIKPKFYIFHLRVCTTYTNGDPSGNTKASDKTYTYKRLMVIKILLPKLKLLLILIIIE